MKISGEYALPVAPDRAYSLLQDPVLLAKCMPGCERLDLIGEDEYAMRMKMVLASMSGLFDGKVRIADPEPPVSFRLVVEGSGKIGFMKGDGKLTMAAADAATRVQFDGEVQVGGLIANVGQRLLDTTSRMLIKRFFRNMTEELSGMSAAAD